MKVFTVADMERESWAATLALFQQVDELFPHGGIGCRPVGGTRASGRSGSRERAEYGERLDAAVAEAMAAGSAAMASHMAQSARLRPRHVSASVFVHLHRPSARFAAGLKARGLADRFNGGCRLTLGDFGARFPPAASAEAANVAACQALARRFPEEGNVFVRTHRT